MAGVTLKKLAELSGLSVRTVNRVLKDQGDVSPAKRELVRQLAAQYNYIPDIAARNFRLRRKNIVGVVTFDRMLYEAQLHKLSDLERRLTAAGYYPLLGCTRDRDVRAILEEWNGAVEFVVVFNFRPERGDRAEWKNYPYQCIFVDCGAVAVPGARRIAVDRATGIAECCRCFADAGCRRILHCGTSTLRLPLVRRSADALRERAEFLHIPSRQCEFEDGYASGDAVMQSGADAVFFDTDRMAAGFYRYAWENRIRIPDDISVAGFDDDTASAILPPPLSTVAHPVAEISSAVLEIVLGASDIPEERVLPTRFVRRASIRS